MTETCRNQTACRKPHADLCGNVTAQKQFHPCIWQDKGQKSQPQGCKRQSENNRFEITQFIHQSTGNRCEQEHERCARKHEQPCRDGILMQPDLKIIRENERDAKRDGLRDQSTIHEPDEALIGKDVQTDETLLFVGKIKHQQCHDAEQKQPDRKTLDCDQQQRQAQCQKEVSAKIETGPCFNLSLRNRHDSGDKRNRKNRHEKQENLVPVKMMQNNSAIGRTDCRRKAGRHRGHADHETAFFQRNVLQNNVHRKRQGKSGADSLKDATG